MSAPPFEVPRRPILPNRSGRSDLNAKRANRGNNRFDYNRLDASMTLTIRRRRVTHRKHGSWLWQVLALIIGVTSVARFNQRAAGPTPSVPKV